MSPKQRRGAGRGRRGAAVPPPAAGGRRFPGEAQGGALRGPVGAGDHKAFEERGQTLSASGRLYGLTPRGCLGGRKRRGGSEPSVSRALQ